MVDGFVATAFGGWWYRLLAIPDVSDVGIRFLGIGKSETEA
jgi:hypothetical protein